MGRSAGSLVLRPGLSFNGVKVFSATMFADRERLGEKITDWIGSHPQIQLIEISVTQSSDASFHCLAITVFYFEPPRGRA